MTDKTKRKILIVEDDPPLLRLYEEYLRDDPYDVCLVDTGKKALAKIADDKPDAIILDVQLPDVNGIEILKRLKDDHDDIAVVVITAHGSVNLAVEAMREGAADFLMKPFNSDRLLVTLQNALERVELKAIVQSLTTSLDRTSYCGFIGKAPVMQAVYRIIDNAASSKATVFITGESGTGKEVCAEAIHQKSPRDAKPFIALNCGAIPSELMESEIFGHVKGAFTGAHANRDGAATHADGGTLFLDEICEMDLSLQVKLLRFIQTGTFQKVGGSKNETVDVRFVCATNKDPWKEVEAGNFREDLYYRLHVIPVHLPPLRDRGGDVLDIAEAFLATMSTEESKGFEGFSDAVKGMLMTYGWPGNVRQLQNIVRNVVVLHDGPIVEPYMIPPPVAALAPEGSAPEETASIPTPAKASQEGPVQVRPMWQVERELINEAIRQSEGNVSKAAALLELSPSTIYRRLREADERAEETEQRVAVDGKI